MPVAVPHDLDEVFAALEAEPEAELLAGGTDFMVETNAGRRRPRSVIALRNVGELGGWRRKGGDVVLGAGLTYREMLEPSFATLVPALAQAARTIGSPQVRNAGTLGGNLATASPAGDTLPVLQALGAGISLRRSPQEERLVTVDDLLTGPKHTSLCPGEVITSVRLPASRGMQEFLKVGPRNAMVISVASVTCIVDFASKSVRISLGSVGPFVLRAEAAEALLAERMDWEARRLPAPARDIADVVELVRSAAAPIDDQRSTATYRLHAVGVCAERAIERILRRAA